MALTGEACGRLLMESDLLTAVKEKMGIVRSSSPHVHVFPLAESLLTSG